MKTQVGTGDGGDAGSHDWYYQDGDAQAGPVSKAELLRMLRSKMVVADSLVWTGGMAEWKPAHDVPALGLAVRSAAEVAGVNPPAPRPIETAQRVNAASGSLEYQGITARNSPGIPMTSGAMLALESCRKWTLFIAVLLWIFVGIYAVVLAISVIATLAGASQVGAGALTALLPMIFVAVFCFIYGYLAYLLISFSSAVKATSASQSPVDLERAVLAMRSFWRTIGIMAIVLLSMFALLLLIPIVIGLTLS